MESTTNSSALMDTSSAQSTSKSRPHSVTLRLDNAPIPVAGASGGGDGDDSDSDSDGGDGGYLVIKINLPIGSELRSLPLTWKWRLDSLADRANQNVKSLLLDYHGEIIAEINLRSFGLTNVGELLKTSHAITNLTMKDKNFIFALYQAPDASDLELAHRLDRPTEAIANDLKRIMRRFGAKTRYQLLFKLFSATGKNKMTSVLTLSQQQIMSFLANGLSQRDIARKQHLTPQSMKTTMSKIMASLNAPTIEVAIINYLRVSQNLKSTRCLTREFGF
jgi:DNA-binding CsgD family transcriptional regulator